MSPAADRGSWMDPLNRLLWKKAFLDRATSITLRKGDSYSIEYSTWAPMLGEDPAKRVEVAWVQPTNSEHLTPCGWIRIEEFTKPLTEEEAVTPNTEFGI